MLDSEPPISLSPYLLRGPLNRASVVACALSVIDRDGIEGLSMRGLARIAGCDPMTLYRHIPNRAALLDAVAEAVLSTVAEVDPADPDWNFELRVLARSYRSAALAHPKVVVLMVTRPQSTPLGLHSRSTLAVLGSVLALLTENGFAPADALTLYRNLFSFLRGHVLIEQQESRDHPEYTEDLVRLALRSLNGPGYSILKSLTSNLSAFDGDAVFERGLDSLLTGAVVGRGS